MKIRTFIFGLAFGLAPFTALAGSGNQSNVFANHPRHFIKKLAQNVQIYHCPDYDLNLSTKLMSLSENQYLIPIRIQL